MKSVTEDEEDLNPVLFIFFLVLGLEICYRSY